MITKQSKNEIRGRIHERIRRRLRGTSERPRLAIFRTLAHIYAQVIDDSKGVTVAASFNERGPRAAATSRRPSGIGKRSLVTGEGKGHQARRVRSRRLSVSWARESAGRCGAGSRTGVLRWRILPASGSTRSQLNLKEKVVAINRVTKVVKGGKNMSFSALVVVGDTQCAKWSASASVRRRKFRRRSVKALKRPRRICAKSICWNRPFRIRSLGRFGAGLVMLKPAPDGTGVIAGGPVRAVVQAAGIPNVLTKSIGSAIIRITW